MYTWAQLVRSREGWKAIFDGHPRRAADALLLLQRAEREQVRQRQHHGQRGRPEDEARGARLRAAPATWKAGEHEREHHRRHAVVAAGLRGQREGHPGEDRGPDRSALDDAVQPEQEEGEPSDREQVQVVDVAHLVGRERGQDAGQHPRPAMPGEAVDQRVEGPPAEGQGEDRRRIEEDERLAREQPQRKDEDRGAHARGR